MNQFTENIKTLINTELPGEKAWRRMMPEIRGINLPNNTTRKAAVLILLYPAGNEIFTLLIKRTVSNGPHSGQISLPGGMMETKDNSDVETAIRETAEETGIRGEDIKILGRLSKLSIPVSNTEVSPFVGYINYRPEFKHEVNEVEYLIEVNLKTLLNPACIKKEPWLIREKTVQVPFFQFQEEKVWGATAMILAEFIDLAVKAGQDPRVQY